MIFQNLSQHLLTLALLLACVVGMLANRWAIPKTDSRNPSDLKAVIYTAAWWSMCALAENLPLPPAGRLFFGNLAWFGISALPLALCSLLWTVTHGRHCTIPPLVRTLAWSFIVLTGLIAFANPYRLMYRDVVPAFDNEGPLHYIHGTIFYVIVLVLYACLLGTIAVTLWQQRGKSPRQRRIHLGIILAVVAPLAASAAYAAGKLLFLSYDPSPFAFLVTAPMLGWLLKRGGLGDPLPVARRVLMEVMVDAVVVTDAEGYIVTCNPTALALPGFAKDACGKPLHASPVWSDVIAKAIDAPGTNVTFQSPGFSAAYFDVIATQLHDRRSWVGHLIVIRDITHYRMIETHLRQSLAHVAGQLEENIGVQETLRAQAHKDPLTNLYNRRALDGFLPALLSDADEHNQSMSAVMIDIDHFKSINDRFGHAVGDSVLQYFATRLMAMMRQSDLAFRMGGEEFLVLLPGTAIEEAIVIVHRWRDAVRSSCNAGGMQIEITLSAGIATSHVPGTDPQRLIEYADAAAYHAKRNGRDQVSVHLPSGPTQVSKA